MSQTVASQYLYYLLAIFGGKSPMTLKVSKEMEATLLKSKPTLFWKKFNGCQIMSRFL